MMTLKYVVGILFYTCTCVLSQAPLPDNCLTGIRRPCSKLSDCSRGSLCIAGKCTCPITKPPVCPAEDQGPTCSSRKRCKPGYSCRLGRCCRDRGCPTGWLQGGSCYLSKDRPKCNSNFVCINDFCCKPPKIPDLPPQDTCPKGQRRVLGSCPATSSRDPAKRPVSRCPKGSTCYKGMCCSPIDIKSCPKGERMVPGFCEDVSRSPGGRSPLNRCPKGSECRGGICCSSPTVTSCPSGKTKVPGFCEDLLRSPIGRAPFPTCPKGSECYKGICCRSDKPPTCPKGKTRVTGSCERSPFEAAPLPRTCPKGSQCHGGICCRSTAICPITIQIPERFRNRLCPVNKKKPDQCQTNADCSKLGKGKLCCTDRCRRKYCYSPRSP